MMRAAIEFMYVQLDSPPEALWAGPGGTVHEIRTRLRLPPLFKHRRVIHRTLHAIAREEGDRGRGGGYESQGQSEKLTQGEALVAAYELRKGVGQT
eukprot:3803628-Prymnesium_polylepis.1